LSSRASFGWISSRSLHCIFVTMTVGLSASHCACTVCFWAAPVYFRPCSCRMQTQPVCYRWLR
jgi:hypothetical protein